MTSVNVAPIEFYDNENNVAIKTDNLNLIVAVLL